MTEFKQMRPRAPFNYFGGKGAMTAKLMQLVPQDCYLYCEPFAGAASLLFARDQVPIEVLNDLNKEIVNFYRVLQNKSLFDDLRHRIFWTPYAKAELSRAIETLDDPNASDVDRAWAYFVCLNMGMSGIKPRNASEWGRSFSISGGFSLVTNSWTMRQYMLDFWRMRLANVQIDCRDAIDCIQYWDRDDAVFYVDPPYVLNTRVSKKVYDVEQDDHFHQRLVDCLLSVKGAVVLSGYATDIYKPLEENGWERIGFVTAAHASVKHRKSRVIGAGNARKNAKRIEYVWRNPKAIDMANYKDEEYINSNGLFDI